MSGLADQATPESVSGPGAPSSAPPSSGLSDAPTTESDAYVEVRHPVENGNRDAAPVDDTSQTAGGDEIASAVIAQGTIAAEEHPIDPVAGEDFPTPRPAISQARDSPLTLAGMNGTEHAGSATATPTTSTRGRPRGRPRGRGRGGAGRGGKRKREDKDDNGDDSDSSEIYSPAATMTKSGRSIQKPTSFVPPPEPSPPTGPKKKRPYRRNPDSAVCKVCLRGTSPAGNMIVFCDGCNTPYHRYCHHPPIDQSVVDEVDKEWFCRQCESERVVPVPEAAVVDFVAVNGAPAEQRQKYFSSLPQGMLVTLLTRATTIHPDLPLFSPDFQARTASNTVSSNGHAHPPAETSKHPSIPTAPGAELPVPDEHPPTYPRPGYGLMRTLPPENEDLSYLVDDEDKYGVFSHVYRAGTSAAAPGNV